MITFSDRAKRMYGSGSHAHAIESFFTPLEAKLRSKNDIEGLGKASKARAEVAAYAQKHNRSVDDVRSVLAAVQEHIDHPRSEEARQSRWAHNWEALREKHGGEQGARAAIARVESSLQSLKSEAPHFHELADGSGAASDLRVIEALSHPGSTEAKKD